MRSIHDRDRVGHDRVGGGYGQKNANAHKSQYRLRSLILRRVLHFQNKIHQVDIYEPY